MRSLRVVKSTRASAPASKVLQRKCDCGNHTVAGAQCEKCRQKQMTLHRWSDGSSEPSVAPPIVHDVLRSPGQPLDTATRGYFEPRFAHDFSRVRVHTDSMASESARAVNALAYTVGRDVVFSSGRYEPQSSPGRTLIAHELAHVIQQETAGSTGADSVSEHGDRHELDADHAAAAALHGDVEVAARAGGRPALQRQAGPAADPRDQIIQLGESNEAANRQRALDLILATYYERPANFDAIVYDPNLPPRKDRPQDAETGPARGEAEYGGRQRITIGPRFFRRFRSRYDQRVRTIGHELQHVSQRSPASQRTVGSTFGGIGVGMAAGALLGAAGLGIAALAGASLSAGIIGGVLGGAAAVGGLIGGIADPFSKTEEPIKDRHTREFLAIHWVVTAQVRGLQPLDAGQTLLNINQPGEGALDRYRKMAPQAQQQYRRQYEEILRIKARLERPPAQKPQMGDFPGPEPPMARADTAVG
jgi:hypothetical protein